MCRISFQKWWLFFIFDQMLFKKLLRASQCLDNKSFTVVVIWNFTVNSSKCYQKCKKNILSTVRRMTGGNRYVVITSQSNDTDIHYLHFYGTKMGLMFYTILKKEFLLKKIRCDSTIIVFHRCKQITWKWLTYSSSCMMYQFHEFLSALYFLYTIYIESWRWFGKN